ncbi:hypothetical protein PS896_01406 [Pseudomonas fluorescens]|jgi:hypothetical protein|uniref:Uncharacterized protein n=1 Tax=Pseudomonas fluorescens TaxID=294 RepID=A0A5E7IMC7_PSEFL|nr:hypothetical protein [Pseudomonas fluorescens]VVO72463.1 hypothetical protein PS896_01406 [Pseudomonas fluorescens]
MGIYGLCCDRLSQSSVLKRWVVDPVATTTFIVRTPLTPALSQREREPTEVYDTFH